MSTDLRAEIEQATDDATKSMVIDTETLGSSKSEQDAVGETVKASQSNDGSVKEQSDQEDAVDDPAALEKQKVWKKPANDEPDEQQDNEEGEDESDDAVQKDGEKEEVDTGISQTSLVEAFEVGISLEDARTFKNDEDLSEFVGTVKRGIQAQATVQVQEEKAKEAVEAEKENDPFKDLELDPEKYEDDVVELFGKMKGVVKHQQEQLNEFRQQQIRTASSSDEAVKREVTQWFDGQVTGLGDEFVDSLGKGDIGTLTLGSPQLAKREEIANQMAVQMAGYQAIGSPLPPREKVFADAAQIVLGSEFRKSQERKLQKKLTDRESKHISRAGGRGEKEKLSDEDAIGRMLDEKFQAGR